MNKNKASKISTILCIAGGFVFAAWKNQFDTGAEILVVFSPAGGEFKHSLHCSYLSTILLTL